MNKKKVIFRILLMLLPVFIFIITEFIFSLKFRNEFGCLRCSKNNIKPRFQDSPYTVYEPVPYRFDGAGKFLFNNYGFRNDEDVKNKDKNTFRIFILGGSAAYGYPSDPAFAKITGFYKYQSRFTIAAYLQKNLSLSYPGKKIEVFNAAVNGFTINQEYNFYMGTIRKLEPDLIILIDGYNDILFPLHDSSFYRADLDRESWKKYEYRKLRTKLGLYFTSKSYALMYLIKYLSPQSEFDPKFFKNCLSEKVEIDKEKIKTAFLKNQKNIIRAVDDILKRYKIFNQTCRIDGVRILYCPQPLLTLKPVKNDVETACYNFLISLVGDPENQLPYFDLYEYYLSKVDDWTEKEDIPYINLQKKVNKNTEQIFVDYCHFTLYGNNFIAGLITKKIIDMKIIY